LLKNGWRFGQHRVDFAEKSRQPAQVHLIVPHNSHHWLRRSPTQIVEVMLRNLGRRNVVFAVPAEPPRIEDAPFKFREPHAAQAQPPQRARRMQQVQVSRQLRGSHRAGHGKAIFEQRPVERFAVEGHQDLPFLYPFREFLKQGIFFREVAHQELFDLQSPGILPS